jgi:hypothetical protein
MVMNFYVKSVAFLKQYSRGGGIGRPSGLGQNVPAWVRSGRSHQRALARVQARQPLVGGHRASESRCGHAPGADGGAHQCIRSA